MKSRSFDRLLLIFAIVGLLGLMFLPLLLLSDYSGLEDLTGGDSKGEEEVAVGLAVIIRTTARRLLRTGAQNVLRTTFAAFTRTSARTFTRRIVRAMLRPLTLVIAGMIKRNRQGAAGPATQYHPLVAYALGSVSLFLSFYIILRLLSPENANTVTGGLDPILASVLAAVPLTFYFILTRAAGAMYGVQVYYKTELDGLLLQAYFTGATSFMPLTTDVDYVGTPLAKTKLATVAILGLLGIHLILFVAGRYYDSQLLLFLSGSTLLYAFVFSFPLQPLDGEHIWRRSKLLWLAIWAPIMIAFVTNLPAGLATIL